VLGTGGWALSGCQLSSGGGDTTQLIVDFSDRLAVNARNTVRTSCGDLPGISAVPPRSKDVSVYFDIQHANNREVNALGECVNQLATQQPSLGIRGYRIDDGSMS
jgi:hypothetical protein